MSHVSRLTSPIIVIRRLVVLNLCILHSDTIVCSTHTKLLYIHFFLCRPVFNCSHAFAEGTQPLTPVFFSFPSQYTPAVGPSQQMFFPPPAPALVQQQQQQQQNAPRQVDAYS